MDTEGDQDCEKSHIKDPLVNQFAPREGPIEGLLWTMPGKEVR
jgi:hypothetical protein